MATSQWWSGTAISSSCGGDSSFSSHTHGRCFRSGRLPLVRLATTSARCSADTLRDYGFSNGDTAKVIDDGPDVFAKAADRGVIGSMVDYGKMLRHAVDY